MSKKVIKYIPVCIIVVILLNMLFPTYYQRERKYYADRDNFITVTATVADITYYEESNQVCIQVTDKSISFTDTGFIIRGESLDRIVQNGFAEKIQIGNEITFVCAPRYFGDGYKIPIVALSAGDEQVLGFEEGYANLLSDYGIKER